MQRVPATLHYTGRNARAPLFAPFQGLRTRLPSAPLQTAVELTASTAVVTTNYTGSAVEPYTSTQWFQGAIQLGTGWPQSDPVARVASTGSALTTPLEALDVELFKCQQRKQPCPGPSGGRRLASCEQYFHEIVYLTHLPLVAKPPRQCRGQQRFLPGGARTPGQLGAIRCGSAPWQLELDRCGVQQAVVSTQVRRCTGTRQLRRFVFLRFVFRPVSCARAATVYALKS